MLRDVSLVRGVGYLCYGDSKAAMVFIVGLPLLPLLQHRSLISVLPKVSKLT